MVLAVRQRSLTLGLLAIGVGMMAVSFSSARGDESMAAGPPSPFYYSYAQPGYPGVGVMTPPYPAPRPTPPLVGHTYVTYQPFLPQEYLYDHTKFYFAHQPGAGINETTAHWGTRRLRKPVHGLLIGKNPVLTGKWSGPGH
jgi:hypothetical protein